MTYNQNIPQPTDFLSDSQGQIQQNFLVANTVMDINHYPFNNATTNKGKHKFLQMPDQVAAPAVAADELGFYVKAVSGVSQFFMRGENGGSEYQMTVGTAGVDPNFATFGTNTGYLANHTGGWTFLPGGLIMQYGERLSLADGNNVVTFPRTFPTAVFSVVTTMNRNSSNVDVLYAHTLTTTKFTMRNTSTGNSGFWYAIGN